MGIRIAFAAAVTFLVTAGPLPGTALARPDTAAPAASASAPARGAYAGEGGGSRPAGFTRPLGVGLVVGSLAGLGAVGAARRRDGRR